MREKDKWEADMLAQQDQDLLALGRGAGEAGFAVGVPKSRYIM